MPIYPYFCVAIDAIEGDKDLSTAPRCIRVERFAVPANPAREVARATGIGWREIALHRPVMRQIDLPPRRRVHFRLFRSANVPEMKQPVAIEQPLRPNCLTLN